MTHKVASKLVNACIESMSWHDFDARHDQPPTRASQDVRSFNGLICAMVETHGYVCSYNGIVINVINRFTITRNISMGFLTMAPILNI